VARDISGIGDTFPQLFAGGGSTGGRGACYRQCPFVETGFPMDTALLKSRAHQVLRDATIPELPNHYRGKVRDNYDLEEYRDS